MKSLVVCVQCRRHVRRSESQCPFCSQPVVAAPDPQASSLGAGSPPGGARAATFAPVPAQRQALNMKRATLFALGVGVIACETTQAVPVYGAPVPPMAGAGGMGGVGGMSGGGSAGLQAVPVYGAPVAPGTGGAPNGTEMMDSGVGDDADASVSDSGVSDSGAGSAAVDGGGLSDDSDAGN